MDTTTDYASQNKLLSGQKESRKEQFQRESDERIPKRLERSLSADMDKENKISRFIKKGTMQAISECDSKAESDEDGYLSDPLHVNENEYEKLYKVAPKL